MSFLLFSACGGGSTKSDEASEYSIIIKDSTGSDITNQTLSLAQGEAITVQITVSALPDGASLTGFATDLNENLTNISIITGVCEPATSLCEKWTITANQDTQQGEYPIMVSAIGETIAIAESSFKIIVTSADNPSGDPNSDETLISEHSQNITTSGGTVFHAEAQLDIPTDALKQETTITVKKLSLRNSPVLEDGQVVYDFGPNGLVFENPADLTLTVPESYNLIAGETIAVAKVRTFNEYEDPTKKIQILDAYESIWNPETRTVTAKIEGFSRIAFVWAVPSTPPFGVNVKWEACDRELKVELDKDSGGLTMERLYKQGALDTYKHEWFHRILGTGHSQTLTFQPKPFPASGPAYFYQFKFRTLACTRPLPPNTACGVLNGHAEGTIDVFAPEILPPGSFSNFKVERDHSTQNTISFIHSILPGNTHDYIEIAREPIWDSGQVWVRAGHTGSISYVDKNAPKTTSYSYNVRAVNKTSCPDPIYKYHDSSGAGVGTAGIPNKGTPVVSFGRNIFNYFAAEGTVGQQTAMKFIINLSRAMTDPVTLEYATVDGTAIADGDYLSTSGNVTFAPGDTQQEITVLINGDMLVEGNNETFNLELNNLSANAVFQAGVSKLAQLATIVEDDVSVIQYSVDRPTIIEGASGTTQLTFTVTLDQVATEDLEFQYYTSTTGLEKPFAQDFGDLPDFEGVSLADNAVMTILKGQTVGTIDIVVKGDKRFEPDEKIGLTLAISFNKARENPGSATPFPFYGLILNDDCNPELLSCSSAP